jgi:hypothetical protein
LFVIDAVEFQDVLRSNVGSEDADAVPEIHNVALAIRDTAIVQHLKHDIEYIWMSLLHLIEKYDGIRLSSNGIGKLTTLVVPDIS